MEIVAKRESVTKKQSAPEKKVALVTGASSGIGLLTAEYLLREGYRVFGTSRRELPNTERGVEMFTLDVRSEESVRECVGRVLGSAGQIDLLVNNAGVLAVGPAEETSPEDARSLFETNFFGVTRVTDAALPSMRRRRAGRIVNVSSLAGMVAVPGEAFYSASKFALEGYSEALRHELRPYGIVVSLVEPGFFATNIHHSSEASSTTRTFADYDSLRSSLRSSINDSLDRADDPKKVAQTIARIARKRSPRLRYRVGDDARWAPLFTTLLPERVFEAAVRKRFGLPDNVGEPALEDVASEAPDMRRREVSSA